MIWFTSIKKMISWNTTSIIGVMFISGLTRPFLWT